MNLRTRWSPFSGEYEMDLLEMPSTGTTEHISLIGSEIGISFLLIAHSHMTGRTVVALMWGLSQWFAWSAVFERDFSPLDLNISHPHKKNQSVTLYMEILVVHGASLGLGEH